MDEQWKSLKVGDWVRIVRLPYQDDPTYKLHEETRQFYELLIARRRPLKVKEIDKDGLPWIFYRYKDAGGCMHYHSLAICDDSWVRVKHRRPKPDKE